MSAIGEEAHDPWRAFVDAIERDLGASTVGNVRCGQADHPQLTVGIHGDVPLASNGWALGYSPGGS